MKKMSKKEIKVGIYWQIDDELLCNKEVVEIKESTFEIFDDNGKCIQTVEYKKDNVSRISSTFGHDSIWEKFYTRKYKNADYATHPRGRVLYDLQNNRHIIFADKCVTQDNILKLVEAFEIGGSEYTVERDFHYMCDKCVADYEEDNGSIFDD